jgi:transcriptional regulator with XRE-family HTH domain
MGTRGRPENALDPAAGPVQAFAAGLRALREEAGNPSYRKMGARASYSHNVLSRAADGKKLPTLAVTLAYVRVCGGDEIEWRERWKRTKAALSDPQRSDPRESVAVHGIGGSVAVHGISDITTNVFQSVDFTEDVEAVFRLGGQVPPPVLADYLRRLADTNGRSLRELAAETGLARSTLSDWHSGRTTPTEEGLERLLRTYRRPEEAVHAAVAQVSADRPSVRDVTLPQHSSPRLHLRLGQHRELRVTNTAVIIRFSRQSFIRLRTTDKRLWLLRWIPPLVVSGAITLAVLMH